MLNIAYGFMMKIVGLAMSIDRFRISRGRVGSDVILFAEVVAPRVYTIQAARDRVTSHMNTATFALSWVTLTPFRYYVPMAVVVTPFRRLAILIARPIAAAGEFAFDTGRTTLAIYPVLVNWIRNLPARSLPSMPSLSLRRLRLGHRSSTPRLSRGLTMLAAFALPPVDREEYAQNWYAELFVHPRLHRALIVIGIWRKLPVLAWGLRTYGRRQVIR
ncbi:hypothetical protein GCM10009838_20940 [Catenulispora subtropica]|uniref:Uncharacterized protein n=2 Tax=Catenulispora subtropica TaxID=450798 RepID=A0ABN2R5E0_9ACTN